MNYSLKAKCQGCKALLFDNNTFSCAFDIPLIVEEISGNQHKPMPNSVKCYKPLNTFDLRAARLLMKSKQTV